MFCRAELARLAKLNPHIEAKGARLAVMTLGQPAETGEFCGERAPGVACYSDAAAEGFRTYGLTRGNLLQMLGPDSVLAAIKASSEGHMLGKVAADPWQMPGTFIIDRQGTLHLAYYSKHAGDYPAENLILGHIPS